MNKLILGAGGQSRWPGYITVDANPAAGAHYTATLPPLPSDVKAQQWDEILCIHFIEHIPPWEADVLLRECYDALAPGGKLILEQPNILYCAQVLLGLIEKPHEDFPHQFDLAGLYGDPGHRDALMLHRWGYTPVSLTDALIQAGFSRDRITEKRARFHQPARDFLIEARK